MILKIQPLCLAVFLILSIEHCHVNGISSIANGVFKNGKGSVVSDKNFIDFIFMRCKNYPGGGALKVNDLPDVRPLRVCFLGLSRAL